MAVRLLLRRGRNGTLKTVLLEGQVLRGLSSTVPLSAQSGKNEKDLPPNPKKQSPPKNVEEAKEKGKLLTTRPAAATPPGLSRHGSSPAAGSRGREMAGARPSGSGSKLLVEEGLPKALARKTLVAFPQKVPSPFRVQGLGAKTHGDARKVTDDSSSSSSSSSDSESDEEQDVPEVGPQVGSKGQRGSPSPQATRPSEKRPPSVTVSAEEQSRAQKPHSDVTYPERASQPKRKRSPPGPLEGREEATPEQTAPRSRPEGQAVKQKAKEEPLQKTRRPKELEKGSRTPLGVEGMAGASTQPAAGPVPTPETQEASRPGVQVPAPDRKLAAPWDRAGGGPSGAEVELLEDRGTTRSVQPIPVEAPVPVEAEAQATGLKPEEGTAPPPEAPGDTQESAQAPTPAEPYGSATYKNLQHHDYSTYTFLDLNLDLSKFRLPQPSSGRESPRH